MPNLRSEVSRAADCGELLLLMGGRGSVEDRDGAIIATAPRGKRFGAKHSLRASHYGDRSWLRAVREMKEALTQYKLEDCECIEYAPAKWL